MIYGEICIRIPKTQQKLYRVFCAKACQAIRTMQAHCHDSPEISVVISGKGIYQTCDRRYCFKQGDIFLFASKEIHYITEISDDLSLMNIQFKPDFLQPMEIEASGRTFTNLLRNNSVKIDNRLPSGSTEAERVKRLIQEIFDECRNGLAGYEIIIKAKTLETLVILLRRYLADNPGRAKACLQKSSCMEKAADYIHKHITEPISLAMLAKEVGMSRTYLSSRFKEYNGITLWDYITRNRVSLAMHWLAYSDESVTNIAGYCGFNSIANFNQSFKKIAQQTPREFRKRGASKILARTERQKIFK